MPFTKVGPDRYKGPSGKTFDYAQVKLYYSQGGKFPSKGKARKKKKNA